MFDAFWNAYPKRNGRRVGRTKSWQLFRKIAVAEQPLVVQAAQEYARGHGGYVRDPERFLKDDFWRDWLGSTESTRHSLMDQKTASELRRSGIIRARRERGLNAIGDIIKEDGDARS